MEDNWDDSSPVLLIVLGASIVVILAVINNIISLSFPTSVTNLQTSTINIQNLFLILITVITVLIYKRRLYQQGYNLVTTWTRAFMHSLIWTTILAFMIYNNLFTIHLILLSFVIVYLGRTIFPPSTLVLITLTMDIAAFLKFGVRISTDLWIFLAFYTLLLILKIHLIYRQAINRVKSQYSSARVNSTLVTLVVSSTELINNILPLFRHTIKPVINFILKNPQLISRYTELLLFLLAIYSNTAHNYLGVLPQYIKSYISLWSEYLKKDITPTIHTIQPTRIPDTNPLFIPKPSLLLFYASILELITNAVKYGTQINISVEYSSDHISCIITNNTLPLVTAKTLFTHNSNVLLIQKLVKQDVYKYITFNVQKKNDIVSAKVILKLSSKILPDTFLPYS